MIEITTVGGYSEVGKNMTCIKYKDEAVILDMGVHLENYIQFKGEDDLELFDARELIKAKAIPDDSSIKDWRKNVIAIVPSHAHLDHIAAIPYLAQRYDCPIICTPYTAAVIKALLADKKMAVKNEIIVLQNNKRIKLSDSITIEFVNITHSIPDAATIVLHTPAGKVVYCNDYKFDNTPVLGEKPNYERLTELGDEGKVNTLIIDSLYASSYRRTPSEAVAKEMLKEVMLDVNSDGKAVIVTTFSSHIARLKSIVEFGKQMKRKIVFLGRSLAKYVYAAESIGLVSFSKSVEIVQYKDQIGSKLKKIEKEGKDKYLIVATGHQGEPDAVLSKIVNGKLHFKLEPEDHVIFSCTVIPSPLNVTNREALESKLIEKRARIFRDIHQSGHASREDQRDMIKMLRPKNIIPGHVPPAAAEFMVELSEEMGYKLGKNLFVMEDGKRMSL